MLFDNFLDAYKATITNNIYSLSHIKSNFKSYKIYKQENNVFLYDNKMLLYFVNDIKKFNIKPCYVKLINKTNDSLQKHYEFLKLNDFYLLDEYVYMNFNNNGNFNKKNIFINYFDTLKIINFLKKYFKNYALDINDITNKILNKQCLVYIKNDTIYGVLIFSLNLTGVFIDYIAVDKSCDINNLAYLLLCEISANHNKKLNLFVDITNAHTIRFYERFGFVKQDSIVMKFYKNY